jgi:hypothetical protein
MDGGREVSAMANVIDEETLDRSRTPEQREALSRLDKQAEARGVKPLDFDALMAKADFWPEDESIDDFIATIRKWRSESSDRKLP